MTYYIQEVREIKYDTWKTDNGQDTIDAKFEALKEKLDLNRDNILDWVHGEAKIKNIRKLLDCIRSYLVNEKIVDSQFPVEIEQEHIDQLEAFDWMVEDCLSIEFENA